MNYVCVYYRVSSENVYGDIMYAWSSHSSPGPRKASLRNMPLNATSYTHVSNWRRKLLSYNGLCHFNSGLLSDIQSLFKINVRLLKV